MRAEREKLNAKIRTRRLRMTTGRLELDSGGESCYLILVTGGSCSLEWNDSTSIANPGGALLLGPGKGVLRQVGHTVPELSGCEFPQTVLHELKTLAQREYLPQMFEQGQVLTLYGSVQWRSRLRTILELMQSSDEEANYPGGLYLALVLHYVEQEYQAASASHPHNETVERVCAYLAARYQQKISMTEVAAEFYLSPYYLSRLFRRVTGQSTVDYVNGLRIEASLKLLSETDLSIGAVAEQTGFASAAHFRRVFRETMDISPLQYRKSHRNHG